MHNPCSWTSKGQGVGGGGIGVHNDMGEGVYMHFYLILHDSEGFSRLIYLYFFSRQIGIWLMTVVKGQM